MFFFKNDYWKLGFFLDIWWVFGYRGVDSVRFFGLVLFGGEFFIGFLEDVLNSGSFWKLFFFGGWSKF